MSTIKSMAMALVMAVAANAEIVDNYYWQKYDKIFDKNIEIKDGIPYGTDEATDHFVQSSRASCGHKDDYLTQANVLRVRRVFPIAKFNEFTNEANRDCQYSYDNFLRAVAKYPAFCNESAHGDSVVQLDEMCKKELATLFAHMSRTSDNFTLTEEAGCSQYSQKMDCARGPIMIMDQEYGEFSASFFEGFDRSDKLLDEPELVAKDGYHGFASAIWKYMRIAAPGPSAHSCMTGYFQPNNGDNMAGHHGGFGTTMLIMQPKGICGTYSVTEGAKDLVQHYNDNLEALGLEKDSKDLKCDRAWSQFSWSGSANTQLYFQWMGWGANKDCRLVGYTTEFAATEKDGYKKCVCSYLDADDPNCQQAEYSYNADPEPRACDDSPPGPLPPVPPQPEKTPLEELLEMLNTIKMTPHFSDQEMSLTTWQVDETLDYVEEQLYKIEQAFISNGIM